MKTLVVRSFFFINFFRKNRLPEITILLSHFLTSHQFLALVFLNFCVTVLTVTSDDVCCNIRNVKYKMKMFVTAVCFLFLLKLKWPKDKSIYDVTGILYGVFSRDVTAAILVYPTNPREIELYCHAKVFFCFCERTGLLIT